MFNKENIMGVLVHVVTLPEMQSTDVVVREVHIVINGVERIVKQSPDIKDCSISAKHGDQVSVFVVDIDDAKNASKPSESLDWLVVDNIAPRTPGKPVMFSIEEEPMEELVMLVHEHCPICFTPGYVCELKHEHCGVHVHCVPPCNLVHEHCGEACFSDSCAAIHSHCATEHCEALHEHCENHSHCSSSPCVAVHAHCEDKSCACK